jgi:hypothetical protein
MKSSMIDIIKTAESLSEFKKWQLYFRYLAAYYSLKHCHIITITKRYDKDAFTKGAVRCEAAKNYNYHLKSKIYDFAKYPVNSFIEFTSNERIIKVDVGENWESQGFAQRYWNEYEIGSIFYWLQRD